MSTDRHTEPPSLGGLPVVEQPEAENRKKEVAKVGVTFNLYSVAVVAKMLKRRTTVEP
jgi:hypothetical protein